MRIRGIPFKGRRQRPSAPGVVLGGTNTRTSSLTHRRPRRKQQGGGRQYDFSHENLLVYQTDVREGHHAAHFRRRSTRKLERRMDVITLCIPTRLPRLHLHPETEEGRAQGWPGEAGRGGGQDSRRRRSALHFVHVERVWRLCVSACIPPPTVCFCKHTYAITFRCCKHTLSSSWCTSRPSRRPRLSSPALASAPGNQTQLG